MGLVRKRSQDLGCVMGGYSLLGLAGGWSWKLTEKWYDSTWVLFDRSFLGRGGVGGCFLCMFVSLFLFSLSSYGSSGSIITMLRLNLRGTSFCGRTNSIIVSMGSLPTS